MLARFLAAWLLIFSVWGCQSIPPGDTPEAPPTAAPDDTVGPPTADAEPSGLLRRALMDADAFARDAGPAAAAALLMTLPDGLASSTAELAALNDATWRHLARVDAATLRHHGQETNRDARGWWQLGYAMRTSPTLAEQRRRYGSWLAAWTDHPAATQPPTALQPLLGGTAELTRVGLLLPLSGPLGRAGRAVRDGFIASYLGHRDDVDYVVNVYDVAAQPLPVIYERALLDGNQLLIGPLSRDSVTAMNRLDPEVPVLALNHLGDEIPAPNLIQIGLAIEDEAYALADWMTDAELERVLLFHSRDDWSVRAMRAIRSVWHGPLEVQTIEDIRTVTESVGVAMRVAESHRRHAEIQTLLAESLEFSPRARGDVDAIVALVSALEATALVPALRFHFADGVPVFVTSQTVRGLPSGRLSGLNGFRVSELPGFVGDDATFSGINQAFALEGNLFVAMYALGADAFRLADRLPLMLQGALSGLLGSTGELDLLPDGRMQRQLARTQVRGGRIQPILGN
jgi:uncharacterized protein